MAAGVGEREPPPLGLFKLQLGSGEYAGENSPAQCWRLGQVGELVCLWPVLQVVMRYISSVHSPPVCMQTYAQRDALALLPVWSLTTDGCCSALVGTWNKPLQRNYN